MFSIYTRLKHSRPMNSLLCLDHRILCRGLYKEDAPFYFAQILLTVYCISYHLLSNVYWLFCRSSNRSPVVIALLFQSPPFCIKSNRQSLPRVKDKVSDSIHILLGQPHPTQPLMTWFSGRALLVSTTVYLWFTLTRYLGRRFHSFWRWR